jgi:hypothetical protein
LARATITRAESRELIRDIFVDAVIGSCCSISKRNVGDSQKDRQLYEAVLGACEEIVQYSKEFLKTDVECDIFDSVVWDQVTAIALEERIPRIHFSLKYAIASRIISEFNNKVLFSHQEYLLFRIDGACITVIEKSVVVFKPKTRFG